MSTTPGKTVLITGANAGIGKDVARQLALRPEFTRIYLACRNQDRARTAKAELEPETGRNIFEIVLMDVADPASVRAGLAGINGSLDGLVMNAGVIGPQSMGLTADGITTVFATNVLGHVVLLEGVESDYPHADSTWPDTQQVVARNVAGLSAPDAARITHRNAPELFRHPLPDDGWLTNA